jgi:predicted nucleotidyltransferase
LTKAEYFGSYAEGEASEESDLDILVEFEQPKMSILTIIRLKHYLEEELAKTIDIIHAPLTQGAVIEIGKTVRII